MVYVNIFGSRPYSRLKPRLESKDDEDRDTSRVRTLSHVHCSCGNEFYTRSTSPSCTSSFSLAVPPVLHGEQKLVDTGGRVERFRRRAAKSKKD